MYFSECFAGYLRTFLGRVQLLTTHCCAILSVLCDGLQVASLHSMDKFPVVEVCSEGVAYRQMFGHNPVAFAQLFQLMNT